MYGVGSDYKESEITMSHEVNCHSQYCLNRNSTIPPGQLDLKSGWNRNYTPVKLDQAHPGFTRGLKLVNLKRLRTTGGRKPTEFITLPSRLFPKRDRSILGWTDRSELTAGNGGDCETHIKARRGMDGWTASHTYPSILDPRNMAGRET